MASNDEILQALERLEFKIDRLFLQMQSLRKVEEIMAADLTALTAQVAANTSAEQSAVLLLNQLSDMLKAAATDPAKVQALADSLKGSADKLAAAIVTNTPAAPPAAPAIKKP